MIQAFAEKAQGQGAPVVLDIWEHMNHAFQLYGDLVPEGREAWNRIRQVIGEHLR